MALVLILFRDGLEVEAEMLQSAWRLPFRKLVLAMPLTCVLVAVLTKLVTDLSWTESFLVGALLSPTDPVLSSGVVTNPRVPRKVRHSLNLESGLNDGLALPAVLAFLFSLDPDEGDFVWWEFVLQDVSVGFVTGVLVGVLAAQPRRGRGALYALLVASVAYAAAVLPPEGNGLISVFVCAITLGILRPDIQESFESRSGGLLQVVKLGIFLVFGSLLTFDGLFEDGLAALGIALFTLFVARPAAVQISLVGSEASPAARWFMSWFGPKGVATMAFSLLVLGAAIEDGERIFNIAALAVFISIILHGITDHAGVDWIEKRERSAV